MQLKTLGSVAGIVKSLGDGARSFQEVTAAVEGLTLAQTRAFISTTSLEAEEIKAIFAAKGLEGAELQEAVAATVNAQAHYKLGGAIGGVGNAFKGLAMVIKANPILTISSVFLLVIAGLNKIKQSIDETAEELRTKAAESADTLTESLSNLGDYQKKIEDLKDAINSDDISQSEATEKRKQLLEIQEELIKKYGKEKEAVDYITESIQGETTALGNLQTIAAQNYLNNNIKQIEEANNYLTKLNEQTAPLPFTTVGVGQDPTVVKYEHYADLVSKQIAPMAELLYTDAGKTTVNGISFKGNYEELISQYDEVLSNIRKYLSDNPIDDNSSDEEKWQAEKLRELESYISNLRSRIDNDEEIQKYQKIYNTALDSVLLTSNTYSEYYNKLIEAKNKYTEALTTGNQDEITQTYIELHDLFNEIFSLDFLDEDNVSGESIKAWFEGVKQQIELQSKETPVIIDVQAELDSSSGSANKIKEIAAKNNYTRTDIDAIISKGDLPGQTLSADEQTVYESVKGYVDLWNSVAKVTGQSELTVKAYIDALEKLNVIQKEVAKGSESSFELTKDQTKELKSIYSDVDKLNKAYQNLFDGKLITNDVAELVDLFPTLGEYIDWTDGKFGNLSKGIEEVIKERPKKLIEQLEAILDTSELSDEAKKSILSMVQALKQLHPELSKVVGTKSIFDYIEIKLKRLSQITKDEINKIKEYATFSNKNNQIDNVLGSISEEISANQQAFNEYMSYANSIGLNEDYAYKIRQGIFDIEKITDSDLNDKIKDYQTYYEKAKSCLETIKSLRETEREYSLQKISNIDTYYKNRLELLDKEMAFYENHGSDGTKYVSKNYDAIKNIYQQQIQETINQSNHLQEALNNAISNGYIKMYNDDWYNWNNRIMDCNNNVQKLEQSIRHLGIDQMNQVQKFWDNYISQIDSQITLQTSINNQSNKISDKQSGIINLLKLNQNKKSYLSEELKDLKEHFEKLNIDKYSNDWYEWKNTIDNVDKSIIEIDNSISELNDNIRDLPVQHLENIIEMISKIRELSKDFQSLHNAQGFETTRDEIYRIINSDTIQMQKTQEEIQKITSNMTNNKYGEKGSDSYNEAINKLIELESSLLSFMIEQEQEYDKLIDIEINSLNKQKQIMQEQNEELDKKLSYEKAIEALENARYQKNKLIYREGIGFVYEPDQKAIRDAQKDLDSQYRDKVLDKFDQAINLLEKSKESHNIYNYSGSDYTSSAKSDQFLQIKNGTLHGVHENLYISENLSRLTKDTSNIYDGLFSQDINDYIIAIQNRNLNHNLGGYSTQFGTRKSSSNNNLSVNIGQGAITLYDVNKPNELADAIINELPNQLIQALNKK